MLRISRARGAHLNDREALAQRLSALLHDLLIHARLAIVRLDRSRGDIGVLRAVGSQFLGAQTHPLVSMCFSLVVVISLALLGSLIVVFIMLISLLSCLQERTTGASLVARMRGDARARARREQRAWRARREQRARVQGGRVGARARQRRGRSREEFPVRTFVLSSSRRVTNFCDLEFS